MSFYKSNMLFFKLQIIEPNYSEKDPLPLPLMGYLGVLVTLAFIILDFFFGFRILVRSLCFLGMNEELGSKVLFDRYHGILERRNALDRMLRSLPIREIMSLLNNFKQTFLSRAYVQAHIEGNMYQKEAIDFFEFVRRTFGTLPHVQKNPLPLIRRIERPLAVKVENFNQQSQMSYTVLTWFFGPTNTLKKAAL